MAAWECGLCSHLYDESKESVKWADLPGDWLCPICGSPRSSFTVIGATDAPIDSQPAVELVPSASYLCNLCSHVYDEAKEDIKWEDLPDDWLCPVCGSGKDAFIVVAGAPASVAPAPASDADKTYLSEWHRTEDTFESHMADIHSMATNGHSIIEPMRTRLPTFSWDEVLVKGAQLATLPLNKSQPVLTRTVIGPNAAVPLVIETPLTVSHMSFGALSLEAKMALSKGSAQAGAAMCSGGGVSFLSPWMLPINSFLSMCQTSTALLMRIFNA